MSRHNSGVNVRQPSPEELKVIIQGDPIDSARETVKWAEQLGSDLKEAGLTTSQIRSVFGEVRRIEMNWPLVDSDPHYAQLAGRDLMLLKPKIAYQSGREAPVGELQQVLVPAIDLVENNREYFQRLIDFFEAILAYHKAAGGK